KRFLARRQSDADERQEGDGEREPKGAEQHAMSERRGYAPEIEQAHQEERGNDEERPKQSLPHALEQERQQAQAHLLLKALNERAILRRLRRGRLRAKHGFHHALL